jgi:hypothetical protein
LQVAALLRVDVGHWVDKQPKAEAAPKINNNKAKSLFNLSPACSSSRKERRIFSQPQENTSRSVKMCAKMAFQHQAGTAMECLSVSFFFLFTSLLATP